MRRFNANGSFFLGRNLGVDSRMIRTRHSSDNISSCTHFILHSFGVMFIATLIGLYMAEQTFRARKSAEINDQLTHMLILKNYQIVSSHETGNSTVRTHANEMYKKMVEERHRQDREISGVEKSSVPRFK